jgi:cytoskeletal protein RodZ
LQKKSARKSVHEFVDSSLLSLAIAIETRIPGVLLKLHGKPSAQTSKKMPAKRPQEEIVKTRILSSLAGLALGLGTMVWSGTLLAQDSPSTPSSPTPSSTQDQQQPSQTPTQPPSSQQPSTQQPDSSAQPSDQNQTSAGSASTTAVQEFVGTVQKTGDKYVLKDDSGKTYDVDSQDQLKKFEGKRVRVKGTLDETGTKIMVR